MRKRLVRFGHPVRVLALFHRAAAQVRGVEKLVRQPLLHRLAVAAGAGIADQPADAERQAPVRVHFDRHLIIRSADAPRLHFETRLDVVDRLLEHLQRIVAGLVLDDVEALIDDPLGGAALAVTHHAVDELADQRALIDRIRQDIALRNLSASWHWFGSRLSAFGSRLSALGSRLSALGFRLSALGSRLSALGSRPGGYAFFGRLAPYFDRPCM